MNGSLASKDNIKCLKLAWESFQGQKKDPVSSAPSLNAAFVELPLPGQAIFLPAPSSSSPGAATEPGLLAGTKGAHSISPRCAALLQLPLLQHCSASPPSSYRQPPTSQFQPKYQLSLAQQPPSPTSMLCLDCSEPKPGASFMLHRDYWSPQGPKKGASTIIPCSARTWQGEISSLHKQLRREQDNMAFPRATK